MAKKDQRYLRLGTNIKSLRNARGETQTELADSIGLNNENGRRRKPGQEPGPSKSTISQYETGKRTPERDILVRIAKHFGVTENELLQGDYSNLGKMPDPPTNNLEYNKAVYEMMFPLVCTPEALKNSHFNEAYKIHENLFFEFLDFRGYSVDRAKECKKIYELARGEGVIEAAANQLWLIMFEGFFSAICTPKLTEDIYDYDTKRLSLKDVLNSVLPSFDDIYSTSYFDTSTNIASFLEEHEADMLADILILRKSKKYRDLGDYYLAFRHMFGLLNNSLTKEMNFTVGNEMLLTFTCFGNKYGQRWFDFAETLDTK